MSKKGAIVLFVLLSILFHQFANTGSPAQEVKRIFNEADSLLNLPDLNDEATKQSLKGFVQVIDLIEKNKYPGSDSLLFLSYRNKGILLEIQANYPLARDAYSKAISIKKFDNSASDSLIVMTYINLGSCYYYLNNFDSANYYLQRSDSIIDRFPTIEYKVRLYNTLGVLYHDNGNYRQCKNYFSQALAIIKSTKPFDSVSAASVEINIATAFSRLEQYEEAINIYKRLLNYNLFNNHIYMNMGKAYESLEQYDQAMRCFRKVDASQLPWVFNEMGITQLKLNQPDSSEWYLNKLRTSNQLGKVSLADLGINKMYAAELKIEQKQYLAALDSLQQAIMIFGNIKNADPFFNPNSFTGTFAYYRLFTALSKKALVFNLLYKQNGEEKYLIAAHDTYKSTLSLLNYIEKSFDTDDAKLFLKQRIQPIYQQALLVCLALQELHPQKDYGEQAFLIAEKNKASVIISSLNERSFSKMAGLPVDLLQKERNIKYNIARLTVQIDQAKDTKEAEAISHEKETHEIELARLQKSLERNSNLYKLKYDDGYPTVKTLQDEIGKKKALVSFYATDSIMHAFIITTSSFNYIKIDSLQTLNKNIQQWVQQLKQTESGRRFEAGKIGDKIYKQLVQPVLPFISNADEWIIVPDGMLYLLPFESLPASDNSKFLLDQAAISYQFSSRFISSDFFIANKSPSDNNVLSFAPFEKQSVQVDSLNLQQLSHSADEIADLKGKKFVDTEATKKKFLEEINHYPIVHLATHAVADERESSKSFIAFYPSSKSTREDFLFLDELYGLNMDSTQLVVISACETGKGELVSSEGVLSLSRAFIYAGCGSTVNSLWKADDVSTAAILKSFHSYIRKGYSKSKALQSAKLDYIHSNQKNKSPVYWSHLVIAGNTEPLYLTGSLLWVTFVVLLIIGLLAIIYWKMKKKKVDAFHRSWIKEKI